MGFRVRGAARPRLVSLGPTGGLLFLATMPHRREEVNLELEGPWADHSSLKKSSSSSESVSAVKVVFNKNKSQGTERSRLVSLSLFWGARTKSNASWLWESSAPGRRLTLRVLASDTQALPRCQIRALFRLAGITHQSVTPPSQALAGWRSPALGNRELSPGLGATAMWFPSTRALRTAHRLLAGVGHNP